MQQVVLARNGSLFGALMAVLLAAAPTAVANSGAEDTASPVAFEGDLPRRASLGFQSAPDGDGGLFDAPRLAVSSVQADSAAASAGLQPGDLLVAINGTEVTSALEASETLGNLPGEVEVNLVVSRQGSRHALAFTPPAEPLENLRGVHTTYGVLETEDGTRLRTLLTRPLETEGPLPAILLSDWTSCGSVEVPRTLDRGWINLVRGVVETSDMIVLRVDKPGVGDSLGRCSELDFDETLAYQKKALRQLKAHPDVDPGRVFVFGESVGSFMAPLLARGEDVAGIFVYGGGATTWFERMVTFERQQRELSGRPLADIDREMKRLTRFYHYYLVEGMPLDEIFARDPGLRATWEEDVSYNSATKHYGRPIAFHQQAQRHDFARAWVEADAPALVLMGEYDQFESVAGARTIARAVNRARPGDAELIVYPRMNHQLELYPSREAALGGSADRIVGAELVLADIREWLAEVASREALPGETR